MKSLKKLLFIPVLALGTISSCFKDDAKECPEAKECETCQTLDNNQGVGTVSKDGHSISLKQLEIKVLVDENIGKQKQIYASVEPSSDVLSYSSSDTSVVTVNDKGVITGKKANSSCIVTVKSSAGLQAQIVVNTYNAYTYFIYNGNDGRYIQGVVDNDVEELELPLVNPNISNSSNRSLSIVESGAFYGLKKLKKLIIPEGYTGIGSNAFEGASSLQEISLPSTFTTWDSSSFLSSHNSIKTIKTNENSKYFVTNLSNGSSVLHDSTSIIYAFNNPNGLLFDEVELVGVTKIGTKAYMGVTSLKDISIPNSITTLDPLCFAQCRNLEIVNIPASVVTFYEAVFAYSDNIRQFNVDEGNTNIFSTDVDGNYLGGLYITPNDTNKGKNFLLRAVTKDIVFPETLRLIGQTIQNYYIGTYAFTRGKIDKVIKLPSYFSVQPNAFWGYQGKEMYVPSSLNLSSVTYNSFATYSRRSYGYFDSNLDGGLNNYQFMARDFFLDENYEIIPLEPYGTSNNSGFSCYFYGVNEDFKLYYQTGSNIVGNANINITRGKKTFTIEEVVDDTLTRVNPEA